MFFLAPCQAPEVPDLLFRVVTIMCRMLAVYAAAPLPLAPWLIDAPASLAAQSRCDRTNEHHRDGWGLGWYDDAGLRVQRSVAAACDDPEFTAAATALSARIAFAHVRDASVGTIRPENSHPFTYGPWLFCHNGTIEGFDRLRASFERETLPELQATRRGDTDSEQLFLWLLSNAAREGFQLSNDDQSASGDRPDVAGMYAVVRESLRRLLGWCAAIDVVAPPGLNLFLSDGRMLIAVRHSRTLWWKHDATEQSARGAVVIASEPTDADAGNENATESSAPWRELPDPSILTIEASGCSTVRPF